MHQLIVYQVQSPTSAAQPGRPKATQAQYQSLARMAARVQKMVIQVQARSVVTCSQHPHFINFPFMVSHPFGHEKSPLEGGFALFLVDCRIDDCFIVDDDIIFIFICADNIFAGYGVNAVA